MANKKKKIVKKTTKKTAKKITKKVTKKTTKKVVKKKIAKKVEKKATKKTTKKTQPAKTQTLILTPPVNIDYSKAITPLGDRLVVRVTNSEKTTPGGLIIPDTASSIATGYLKAKVLAVGSGGKSKKGHLRPLDVKIGDTVLFSEHSGTKVSFNSEDLQIIHETDVMGVVQN